MLKTAHQRKFDTLVFWALDRLTREGTRATLNYLQRLESKGVGYVSYQEQWLDSTGPFKDVMISMFATLAKQERARISERPIAGLKVARAKGRVLGRPPLPEETVQKVLLLNRHVGIGARKIAKRTVCRQSDSIVALLILNCGRGATFGTGLGGIIEGVTAYSRTISSQDLCRHKGRGGRGRRGRGSRLCN
jgi:hypothetical protein